MGLCWHAGYLSGTDGNNGRIREHDILHSKTNIPLISISWFGASTLSKKKEISSLSECTSSCINSVTNRCIS